MPTASSQCQGDPYTCSNLLFGTEFFCTQQQGCEWGTLPPPASPLAPRIGVLTALHPSQYLSPPRPPPSLFQ